jgi:hypothetical protein
MPRKNKGGGMFDNISNTFSGWGSSISNSTSGLFGKKSTSTTTTTPSSSTTTSTPSSTSTTPMTTSTYGGRRRRKSRKHMRGGFKDNISRSGLASNASPFSGSTAKPHNWVGGRTRRRRRGSRRR